MTTKQEKKRYQPNTERFPFIQCLADGSYLKKQESDTARTRSSATIELINNYYSVISDSGEETAWSGVGSCFAVRLALFLVDDLSKTKYRLTRKGNFGKEFYRHCIEEARGAGLLSEIDDDELFLIYLKQSLHLLTACGILRRDNFAHIEASPISGTNLYYRLLKAFWNDIRWEDIFPSDPDSARELKINKSILKDLLLRHRRSIPLETVANEFFDMTGFGSRNDLFLISFLDFYFFTWLKHFNLIEYSKESGYAPVAITVTETGRKIFNSIQ